MKNYFIEAGKIAGSFVLSVSLLAIACMLFPVRLLGCVADAVLEMLDDCVKKVGSEYVRKKIGKALDK